MPSRPLSFETQALISLEATPFRMLTSENANGDNIVAELLAVATEWPKRTKLELQRRGRGTPKLRPDLVAIALGRTLWQLREHLAKDGGKDLYLYGERARLLRLVGEAAGGLDEALVEQYEWPNQVERS